MEQKQEEYCSGDIIQHKDSGNFYKVYTILTTGILSVIPIDEMNSNKQSILYKNIDVIRKHFIKYKDSSAIKILYGK